MKIILDDKRPMPEGPYNCVRTYEDCVELLSLFKRVSFLSLDYDLGSDKTGLDVLVYMMLGSGKNNQIWSIENNQI